MKKTNQKRLLKDVVDIIKNPLEDNGIYYKHDDNNMFCGYALIIGPKNTLYNYGNYLFKFEFPKDYPFSPPKLTYLTNNGYTRFHPNLYKTGKVCLSILNTWRGEQWTSCQTIRSILLTLVTLFHNKPLLNEPGLTEKYKDFNNYNEIIQYENYNTAILYLLDKKINLKIYELFKNEIAKNYEKNKSIIENQLIEKKNEKKNEKKKKIEISIYNRMNSIIDYNLLYTKIQTFNETFKYK
jgi:ubiquitin-conjugating enzyme E2 Z